MLRCAVVRTSHTAGLFVDSAFWQAENFAHSWAQGADDRTLRSFGPNADPLVDHLRENIVKLRKVHLAVLYGVPEIPERIVATFPLQQVGAAGNSSLTAEAPAPSASQRGDTLADPYCELTAEELEACTTLATLRGPHDVEDGDGDEGDGDDEGEDGDIEDEEDDDYRDDGDGEEERSLKRARWSADEEAQQQAQEQDQEEAQQDEEEEQKQQQGRRSSFPRDRQRPG
eukprot:m51a1_g5042 hypothetical protein (228) ;mRNA; f:12416-13558